jgi:hypothetical protein
MLPRQPAYMDGRGCIWLQFVMHRWRRPTDRLPAVNSCSEPAAGDDGGSPKSLTVELWSSRARGATSRDDCVVESGSVAGGSIADWTRRLVCCRKRDEGHICSYICRHVRPSLSPWRARAQLEAAAMRVNLELDLRIGKEPNWLQQGPMLQLYTSERPSWLGCWHHQIKINKRMGRKR